MSDHESKKTAETSFERQMREVDEALDAMPDPDPASSRQIIIAKAKAIREKARGRGLEAVWKTFVALGHNVTFGTFRDYVYTGTKSQAVKTVEVTRAQRRHKTRSTTTRDDAPLVFIPTDATESTAQGAPVRARKMR